MSLLTKNVRGWLIGGVLLLYLFPFYSLGLNKWAGWNLGELYTLGLELKDFLTVWTTLGGVVAVVIGIIQTQVRISQQKEQFEKQQRDTRFISGVELLGNPHESTRIGGAYNLYFLAREFKDDYLNPVCEILCAHLRSIAHVDKFKTDEQREKYPRNEVQSIFDLLFKERDGKMIFKEVNPKDLSQICLLNINCREIKLNNVYFLGSELSYIASEDAEWTNVIFSGALLVQVHFSGATFSGVDFYTAELGHVDFTSAKLSNVDFHAAELNNVRFMDAELENDCLIASKLSHANFVIAKLNDVRFNGAKMNMVDFSNATTDGNVDFENTLLEGCTLEEIVKPGNSLKFTAKEQE